MSSNVQNDIKPNGAPDPSSNTSVANGSANGVQKKGPPPPRRKKESFNPFITRKSEAKSRTTALLPGQRPHPTGGLANGHSNAPPQAPKPSLADLNRQLADVAPTGPYTDIPIITTKRALSQGMRHHVMRFVPEVSARISNVDPADEHQFKRPVYLHRRDPRQDNRLRNDVEEQEEEKEEIKPDPEQQKERERFDAAKAERRAEREANQAQIAPSLTKPKEPKQKQKPKKPTEQVFQINDSERKKKEMALRYEEAIPWHIEDGDGNNIWRGTYESALSECHVALVPEQDPSNSQLTRMKMIPIEKWYKFAHKSQTKRIMSIDDAERQMKARSQPSRFVMIHQQKANEAEQQRKANERKTFAVARERKSENMDHAADIDDIDYDERDEFADDEDANIFEGQDDEDAKEASERIKREQQEANFFDNKEEKDYDKEEAAEQAKKEEEKKVQKKMSKALKEREKNYDYEEDSDINPYLSESSEESEELEVADGNKQAQSRSDASPAPKAGPTSLAAAAAAQKKASSNVPSRTASPAAGSSANKGSESLRTKVLKRPGSPNLSEASGNESARKKQKLKKHIIKNEPTGSAAPSRPGSPAAPITNSKLSATRRVGAGSGSEGDTTDASKSKGKKRKSEGAPSITKRVASGVGSPGVSPPASRPGSPLSASQTEGNQSPMGAAGSGSQQVKKKEKKPAQIPPNATLPTAAELRAAVPPEGIVLTDLMKKFPVQSKVKGFADLIRANATFQRNVVKLRNP